MKGKQLNQKLKGILLLFCMTVVSVLTVFAVNYFKKDTDFVSVDQVAKELNIVENTSEALNSIDTASVEKVVERSQGLVLNATTETSNQCKRADVIIESYSVCARSGEPQMDYKPGVRSGQMVSRNSKIELVQVSVPLELFSGSEVKDSNRKLTSKTPIYKPAGEQFDEKLANVLLPPGQNIIEKTSPAQDTPFGSPYSTAFGQKVDEKSQEGEVIVDEKIVNKCEYCNNPSNVNPDKSNKISTVLKNTTQRYPNEINTIDSSDAIEQCSDNATFEVWENKERLACVYGVVSRIINIVKDIASAEWNECTRPDMYDSEGNLIPRSSDCIYVEDIIIMMNSPFGSDRECPDGVCTNSFMNTRNKTAMSPEDSTAYSDKVYYTTECLANVEGVIGPVKVRCAWDFSHLYKERKLAEFDDVPGLEETPTKQEYTNFLKNEAQRRSSEVPVQIF